jgi:threonylcarbamoyladenosine tRNA methylthiotransferase MtaB
LATLRRPRVSLHTLGCKVNQYETRETAAELLRLGYQVVPFGQPVDACVVNTCSVTDQADVKSRSALRRASRCGDDPLVIATGCYADASPFEVAALPGVAAVVRNAEKPRLAEIVDETVRRSGRLLFGLAGEEAPSPSVETDLIALLHAGEGALARTRAVIKIQDGCNHFCSFCIIPFTRGRLRSRPAAEVLAEARRLAELGFKELVLTGICLGDYGDEKGFDRAERDPLALLLEEMAAIPGIERLRLSSIDPADTSDDLIQTMSRLPEVCPHFHLSLQAGDEEVLRQMRRRYTAARFRDLVSRIYEQNPEAGLTCDVIVGFPGETEAQFQETVRLCEEACFLKIHAFPYSPRQGTTAARLEDDVPPAEKQRRVRVLLQLSDRLGLDFAQRHVGETVQVLVEQRDKESGLLSGLTPNYLRVHFEGPDSLRGQIVPITVASAAPGEAFGSLVDGGVME